MEGCCMKKKTSGGFIQNLLERFSSETDSNSFHTSAFTHTFEGIKARFREFK